MLLLFLSINSVVTGCHKYKKVSNFTATLWHEGVQEKQKCAICVNLNFVSWYKCHRMQFIALFRVSIIIYFFPSDEQHSCCSTCSIKLISQLLSNLLLYTIHVDNAGITVSFTGTIFSNQRIPRCHRRKDKMFS
jgi:hypothetical protein